MFILGLCVCAYYLVLCVVLCLCASNVLCVLVRVCEHTSQEDLKESVFKTTLNNEQNTNVTLKDFSLIVTFAFLGGSFVEKCWSQGTH